MKDIVRNIPDFARNKIKMDLRKKTLDRMLEEKAKDDVSGEAISFVLQPEVQNALGAYLEGLNKKKEAKKLRC